MVVRLIDSVLTVTCLLLARRYIEQHDIYDLQKNSCEIFAKHVAGLICEPASMTIYQDILRNRLVNALEGIPGASYIVDAANPLSATWTFMAQFRGLGAVVVPAMGFVALAIVAVLPGTTFVRDMGGL